MIEDLARSEHEEPPAGNAAKQLEQPAIARSVDAGGPRDHDLHASASRGFARSAFAFELRDLIDVAGLQRRVLVRRRMFDVAVHTDSAAVDDPLHAGP